LSSLCSVYSPGSFSAGDEEGPRSRKPRLTFSTRILGKYNLLRVANTSQNPSTFQIPRGLGRRPLVLAHTSASAHRTDENLPTLKVVLARRGLLPLNPLLRLKMPLRSADCDQSISFNMKMPAPPQLARQLKPSNYPLHTPTSAVEHLTRICCQCELDLPLSETWTICGRMPSPSTPLTNCISSAHPRFQIRIRSYVHCNIRVIYIFRNNNLCRNFVEERGLSNIV
jgi:hypothetical protein